MDNHWDSLSLIAEGLTADLSEHDCCNHILSMLHGVIPWDSAILLRVEGKQLTPMAVDGMTADALGRIFQISEHPRLAAICSSTRPMRFAPDSELPDPFNGLLAVDPNGTGQIHACNGIPIRHAGELVAVLCLDALDPKAFDHLSIEYLAMLGNLIGAQIHMSNLLEVLQRQADRRGEIASDLLRSSLTGAQKIIGNSRVMEKLRKEITLVATSDFTVLIQGETGTGKELVARALHRQSRRSTEPMLYLNCAALPESLAESELFGHRKGSFTSAERNRTGKFELADGGTLFLDEVGELPLSIQAKLLRAIQEGEIQPVGSEKVIHTNVRLIAATNRDLTREVEEGRFRRDLFHRLNVYPITVPPLHDHLEDIPLLAGLFIERTQKQLGIPALRINEGALALLQQYNWPGNVRELENIISRAALKASLTHRGDGLIYVDSSHLAGDISPANLPEEPVERISAEPAATTQPAKRRLSLREETKKYQIKLIEEAVRNNDGNWAAAARDLSMNRSNLHNLAGRLGLAKTSR